MQKKNGGKAVPLEKNRLIPPLPIILNTTNVVMLLKWFLYLFMWSESERLPLKENIFLLMLSFRVQLTANNLI